MKKIIFCLPGREFSGRFLQCWTELVYACLQAGIQPILSQHYSPLLYYVRNMCLGGNNVAGIDQLPFQGQANYDYIMWIDSDVVFTPDQLFKLIDADKEIVSGVYMMQDNTHFATVETWDNEFFKANGYFPFLTPEILATKTEPFVVDYTGFGWILMKKGVFESLEYPWFQPIWKEYEIDGKTIRDFTMEDVAFCHMIKEKGYDVYIEPTVRVGHEKMMVL
jgi:GT2 family glycosyltransferase